LTVKECIRPNQAPIISSTKVTATALQNKSSRRT
jgi:hypothetical protein